LTLNPPYNEDSSAHASSSAFMDEAIAWAGQEVDIATAEGRDLVFLLFIPYDKNHASHIAVSKLGNRARVVVRIKAGLFSFESGNLWHSPHPSWPYPCGPGDPSSFPTAIIEVSSTLGALRCDSVHTSRNGAKLIQWAASSSPRGGISGTSLPTAIWGNLCAPLWKRLSLDSKWVAKQHNNPIHDDLGLTPLASAVPPSWFSRSDIWSYIRSIPPKDWQTLLLHSRLQLLPSALGLAGWSKLWRPALLRLDFVWSSYEPLRKPVSTVARPRQRYALRADASSRRIASSLTLSRSSIVNDAPGHYGLDLGRT
jgi:hypothetical protein